MYQKKCGYDASRHFQDLESINLFECEASGMRFWRPSRVAGDEQFYISLSELWPNYYKSERWEYEGARRAIGNNAARVLEIGSGRGYFLKSLETGGHSAVGLEMNREAISNKVTSFPIEPITLEDYSNQMAGRFDCVCSFQVLEHVPNPKAFLAAGVRLLRSGGKLIISTPNYEFPLHATAGDAFDLPPHHLNHFTPDTFRRIARNLGLELVSTESETIREQRVQVWLDDGHVGLARVVRSAINRLGSLLGSKDAVGHTLLAVLRIS